MATGRRDTPAMRQYDAFKRQHPDCLLLFRMGDFYELFDDDAVAASKALGITLTERTAGIPMAGVPYHSYESYVRRLLDAGFRVARCDQIQDAREAKGIVERAVTQVYTPGTLVDEAMLDEGARNALAAVCFLAQGDALDAPVGAGVVELSTGSFTVFACTAGEVADELARLSASELLYASPGDSAVDAPPKRVARVIESLAIPGTPRPGWHFRLSEAMEALLQQYGVNTLAGFGIGDEDPVIPAGGALVRYLRETQALDASGVATSEGHSSGSASAMQIRARSLAHLEPPRKLVAGESVVIDGASLRALEIERTIRPVALGGSRGDGSLLGVFNQKGRGCRTPMGRRELRDWLVRPLATLDAIEARQACVATLVEDRRSSNALAETLGRVQDVARLSARIGLGRATPRDIVGLGRSLAQTDPILEAIRGAPAFDALRATFETVKPALDTLASEIERTCVDSPPSHLRDGGLVRDGIDPDLDEARALQRESGEWLATYQAELVERYELPSLKVGFNKVFGYYIELPRAQAGRAPAELTRKQTLKNAERFISPELKEYEERVLSAGDRAIQRELAIFSGLCAQVGERVADISVFGRTCAALDALWCLSAQASHAGWTRPEITEDPALHITQGRHPVLEDLMGRQFVPNDVALGPPEAPLALLTGPNMAGKSTYIRQVALIALLAHAGSFVPAERARIGLVDRICTRIGADDALHAGQSTFMVEMVETSSILHHATTRSLIVLDEIGRGTSTLDGLALAWAIAERLAEPWDESGASPRALFATHYHELTTLAERMPDRVRNLQVAVREWGDEIVFVHRILEGAASQSYGIHVAKLAGLPPTVVARAQQLLQTLSVAHAGAEPEAPARAPDPSEQLGLFVEYAEHPAVVELKSLEIERMSPLEAFDQLRALKGSVTGQDNGA